MAVKLKRVVDKLEDVPEKHRDLYVERGGRFYLEAEDNDDMAEVRSALEKERTKNTELGRQIKKWEKAGKTPEEIMSLLEGNADLDAAIEKARKDAEVAADKRIEQVNKKHQQDLDKQSQRAQKLTQKIHSLVVEAPALSAVSKHKGIATLLMPHIKQRVKVVEDGEEFHVRVVDAKGEPRVNGKGEFLGLDDLVAEMRESDDFSRAFEGTGAGGSGTRPGGGNGAGGAKTMKRAAFAQMPPAEQMATVTSGVSVVD